MKKNEYESILSSLVDIDTHFFKYKNNITKSKLVCKKHGEFYRSLKQIKNGILCPFCSKKTNTTKQFIEKSILIHKNLYNYDNTIYINSRTKLKIECKLHGEFTLLPVQHLRAQGCQLCKKIKLKEDFIRKATKIHDYIYSKVVYKNNKTNIIVICKKHGNFSVRPDNHLNLLNGCPKCSFSNGELEISNFLIKSNIDYEIQKKFNDCKLKYNLRFDFYLPIYNICIEYNGIQHYKPVKYFGGSKNLEYNNKRDLIKKEYCKTNNIFLYVIKYDENISDMMNKLKKDILKLNFIY